MNKQKNIFLNRYSILFTILLSVCCHIATAQKSAPLKPASQINIGINLITLRSGMPELQLDYYKDKNWGLFAAGGYMTHFSGIRPYDQEPYQLPVIMNSVSGGYWKIGVKFRAILQSNKFPTPWLQLMYVGSQYEENGTASKFDPALNRSLNVKVKASGITHGVALAGGIDLRIYGAFDFRFGTQVGYFKRNDYLDKMYYVINQPGFGLLFEPFAVQMNIGLSCDLGKLKNEKAH